MLDGISRAGRADSQWLSDAVSALFEAAHLRRQLRRLQHPTCTQERSGRENRNRSGARKVGASTVAFARSPAIWSCETLRLAQSANSKRLMPLAAWSIYGCHRRTVWRN